MNNKLRRIIAPVFAAAAIVAAYAEPIPASQVEDLDWCTGWLPSIQWAHANERAGTSLVSLMNTIIADPNLNGNQQEINARIVAWIYSNPRASQSLVESEWLTDCYQTLEDNPS